MTSFSKFRAIALSIAMLSPSISQAIEPVRGFGEFEFGTSVEDVSNQTDIVFKGTEDGGDLYHAKERVLVLGNKYKQSFFFKNDVLRQVSLSRDLKIVDQSCWIQFDEMFAALQAKYGTPDQDPEMMEMAGKTVLTTVGFTGKDLSAIKLLGSALGGNCFLHVAYVAGEGGSEF